jgi:hypothetical protein
MRWCCQRLAPPHSLHMLLSRWCWQRLATALLACVRRDCMASCALRPPLRRPLRASATCPRQLPPALKTQHARRPLPRSRSRWTTLRLRFNCRKNLVSFFARVSGDRPMHTPRAPTAALQAPGIRRPMHTDRIPTAALQAERWPVAMHTLVGWSARALGVLGLFRAPISHTVIAQLSPNHVVRPLSAAHRARAPVAHESTFESSIFSNLLVSCRSVVF